MNSFTHYKLAVFSALISLSACSGFEPQQEIDMTSGFSKITEIERLRYFKEANALVALQNFKLTGKNVRVTIMGEMVDASHPDLSANIKKQYNAFSKKGVVFPGEGNQPFGFEHLAENNGHGTHIAGTIAAACDGVGIQGLACGATIDVYNLGAYTNADRWPQSDWGEVHEYERFLSAFRYALNDLAVRNDSQITTGSFNLEAPAIRYSKGGAFDGNSITEVNKIAEKLGSIDALVENGYVSIENQSDLSYLRDVVRHNGQDASIALSTLAPLTAEWANLENAIAKYQANDAVYIVTESNYRFAERSSVLNAMPTLSTKVDSDLWLSVVMAQPEGIDELTNATTDEGLTRLFEESAYVTPLNSCGEMAADYCILTPSWQVFSTMTKRVSYREGKPIIKLDGRFYQSLDGHSMGAPMVAATLALMQEYNVRKKFNYSMKNLVAILKRSANRSFPGYQKKKHGVGLLDVSAAIAAMQK